MATSDLIAPPPKGTPMTTSKTTPKTSAGKAAAATTDAMSEQIASGLDTCRDLTLKGIEAHRQVAETAFSTFDGQPDPFEVRQRSKAFVNGLLEIAENGVNDATTIMNAYFKGLVAAGGTETGTPKDFAEVGTRIEKTVGELTGLNRTATEQVIEMTTRQAKGFENLVRESMPVAVAS